MPEVVVERTRAADSAPAAGAVAPERPTQVVVSAPPRAAAVWVGRTAAALLGVVLLVATFAKAIDPLAFAEQLRADGLTAGLPPLLAAIGALAVEAAVGLLLLLGVRRAWSLGLAAALVVLFLVITGQGWWVAVHGGPLPAGCGCFGNLVQRSPRGAFVEDFLLLVPLLLLAFVARDRGGRLPARRLAVVAVGVVAVVLLAWRAPTLPLDDWATRLRPGMLVRDICAGADGNRVCLPDVDSGLAQGETWVVLADLAQASKWAARLDALVTRSGSTDIHVLTTASPDEVRAFTWQWGPSFELHEAPPALVRPLYRTLPRSFLVAQGRVVRTVSGLPPAAPAAAPSPRAASASPGDSTR